jgi:hypothetical protein
MTDAAEDGAGQPIERIAVVFVHGQGQQTPMTDVIQLAESVWRTDPTAAKHDLLAPVYSVPVYDGDEAEQRRVVTRQVYASGLGRNVQVDFFQFYWADLMQGNRFEQLWSWFLGLVQKNPRENVVPAAILPLRRLTLGIGSGIGLWGGLLAAVTAWALVATDWEPVFKWAAGAMALLALAGVVLDRAIKAPDKRKKGGPAPIPSGARLVKAAFQAFLWGPFAAAVVIALLCWKLTDMGDAPAAGPVLSLLFWAAAMVELRALLRPGMNGLGLAFSLSLGLIVASCAIGPFATQLRAGDSPFGDGTGYFLNWLLLFTLVPAVAISFVFYLLAKSFLVPVMTESARMFTPAPENVGNQERVRTRGVKLLEYLHRTDAGYDRIVVLAHSLGTAVGYNLLAYYWGKVNGSLDHLGTETERNDVEKAVLALNPDGETPDSKAFKAWRKAVRDYGLALRTKTKAPDQKSAWRISDFITIGSPLTYAPFLMEQTDDLFIDEVETYKRYPLCPPQRTNPGTEPYCFSFDHRGSSMPHHAALFAATTWTNLFFPSQGIAWGDLIGGFVSGRLGVKMKSSRPLWTQAPWKTIGRRGLGVGVLDCPLERDRRLGGFNHNDYWPWPAWLRDSLGNAEKTDDPPSHIAMLRAAFHFFSPAEASDEALAAGAAKARTLYEL